MPDLPDVPDATDYHVAPAVAARVVGGLLVLVAVLLAVATLVVALAGLPTAVLVAVAAVGLLAVLAGHLVMRRLPIVHLGAEGYRVRLVRGAGVAEAAWGEVSDAVTTAPGGLPVVQLRLLDGRTTTVPVTLLDVDRERFVRELQAYLQRGQGLRPLG